MNADISVIGLGKLGLPLSVAFADRGISVIGVDNVPGVVEAVNARVPHIYEPKLQTFLNLAGDRLMATGDLHDAVQRTPISIVLVPTPSDDDGWFSLKYVLEVCAELGQAIRDKGRYHLVVISSTVMPGSCGGEIKAALEKASRDKINKSWGLCYCPEFVALGDCIAGFKRPDFVLIGQSDGLAGDVLESFYIRFVPPGTPIERMALINAELAKISLNCYVTTKISFANQVAEICEKLPGADVDTVTNAIGNDRRIGKRYLKGATAYGGECLLPGTKVQTSKGLVDIQDITVGDLVIAHDGRFHAVTDVMSRSYNGDIVEIMPEGFPKMPVVTTPEHPIWSARRILGSGKRYKTVSTTGERRMTQALGYEGVDFMPASDLSAGDLLALPTLRLENMGEPTINLYSPKKHRGYRLQANPDIMRLIGWYVSEGCTWGKEIIFGLHQRETCYAQDIQNILRIHFQRKSKVIRKSANGMYVRTSCAALARWLRATFGHNAAEKRVPTDFLRLPQEHFVQLLRGIWYGDGSRSTGVYTYGTVSRDLFNFLKLAMLRLGIAFSTKVYPERTDKKSVHHRMAYHLRVCNPQYIRKMNVILPDLFIDAKGKGKKTIWLDEGRMFYHIRSIKRRQHKGIVFNLEVDGANSYMLESAMVHNCFPRDVRAMLALARKLDIGLPLPNAVNQINEWQIERLAHLVRVTVQRAKRSEVGILGLAFKPGTDVTTESTGTALVRELQAFNLHTFDPVVEGTCESAQQCVDESDVIVVTIPSDDFKALQFKRGQVVIDCWRILSKEQLDGAWYVPVGVGA
jgi:UDP-glucose 6-dehydrogenase